MYSLIKGNIVSAETPKAFNVTENGYILLDDGIIKGIFPSRPAGTEEVPVTDYGDRLVMRSFADVHLHAPQYPMLGLGMDLQLMDWLETYTFPLESLFADKAFARMTYQKLSNELIKNGTTLVSVFSSRHTDSTLILMEELEKAGLCGYAGKVNMDLNGGPKLRETTEESISETRRWLEKSTRFSRIRPILTPRFVPSCSAELMEALGRISEQLHVPVQSHLSENKVEMQIVREQFPDCKQYWEVYHRFGLFHSRTVMAHCVHSDERERAALRDNGVLVAHSPDSNVNVCSGFPPIRLMLDEGVRVALASDIAGGDQLQMNKCIASAIRMSKVRCIASDGKEPFLTVPEAYYMATTASAPFFGLHGGFAAGDPLHAIVVDDSDMPRSFQPRRMQDRIERAVYLMDKSSIKAVWSAGRLVK